MSFLKRALGPRGVVCIGIGSDGVALAHLVRDEHGEPQLAVCEYRTFEDPTQPSSTVERAVQDHGLAGATCVAVLPPEQYSLRLVDAPDVAAQELGDAARWLISDLIDFSVDEAVVDFFEIPGQQSHGRPDRIYVVAARAEVVQRVVDVARESELELAAIDITELALRNLSALVPEDARGMALMRLDQAGGLVTMTHEGSLYLARRLEARPAPLAEQHWEAVETGAELEFAPDSEMLDSLVLEVQRSLDYYESQLGQLPAADLLIAPSEPAIPELLPYLAKNLTLNVRALDLNDLIGCSQPLPDRLQARCLPVIGAALRPELTVS